VVASRRLWSSVPRAIKFLFLHFTCFIVENGFSHVYISKHIFIVKSFSLGNLSFLTYWLISRGSLHSSPAMSNPRPSGACGPVEGFVRPSLGFRSSESILYTLLTTCCCFGNLEFDIFDTGCLVFNATLSRLLPLQWGFERFQYISLPVRPI